MAGDLAVMTPLEQGPQGVGNRAIAERLPNTELCFRAGGGHASLLEATGLVGILTRSDE